MRRTAIPALVAIAMAAGCAQPSPDAQRVGIGAAAGAALGAGVGLLFGGSDRRNALIGAGIGAIAGAAAGDYLNRQQRRLEQDLAGTGATVTNTGQQLIVTLPDTVTFDVGSSTVRPQFLPDLTEVATSLRAEPSSFIDVIGHTDSTGSAEFNKALSVRRAQAVADLLIARGVQRERVAAFGQGFSQPVATNDTPEGRAQNRRVEIRITPFVQS
jgi:outer membrane protein OmpA-like peptidoglycan-associated protein